MNNMNKMRQINCGELHAYKGQRKADIMSNNKEIVQYATYIQLQFDYPFLISM